VLPLAALDPAVAHYITINDVVFQDSLAAPTSCHIAPTLDSLERPPPWLHSPSIHTEGSLYFGNVELNSG